MSVLFNTDLQQPIAWRREFTQKFDVMLEIVAWGVSACLLIELGNVLVSRVGFDLDSNNGEGGFLELLRHDSRLGQDGCQARPGSPPRGHRLIDMFASGQRDAHAFAITSATPVLEAIPSAPARKPDGHMNLEFATILSHGSSPSFKEPHVIQSTRERTINKAVEARHASFDASPQRRSYDTSLRLTPIKSPRRRSSGSINTDDPARAGRDDRPAHSSVSERSISVL